MKVRINFYDELININLPQAYKDFKNEIGKKYSIDSADVEELIVFYTDYSSQRVTIVNEAYYHKTAEYFEELSIKKNKLPDIMLEVSEKSMLFMREMENSKLASNLPLQSDNKKDQIQKEIEEKERILKELLEKDKKEAEIKKVKEDEEKEKEKRLKEEEKLRKTEEKERKKGLKEEEKLRKAEEKEKEKRLKEEEKIRKVEEELQKKRLEEEERMKKIEEEALQKQKLEEEARQKQILEEEQEIQRRMHEERQRRMEEEQKVRKDRQSTLREKLMEMKNKIEKEKAKYQEKCCANNEVKVEDDIKVENVDKPCEINIQDNKSDEQEKDKKQKKEKHLKKPKLDSEKEALSDKEKKKELKKKCKQHKKEKASEVKNQFNMDLNNPEFSQILSKVINDNMESAKDKIIKKALKEASKIFEKTRQSLLFSSNISASNTLHSNITCDGCKMFPLIGNRYKCTICEDCDYCELCEEKFSNVHKHPFLKIRRPEVAPYKILCAINDNVPDFIQPKEEKINLNPPSEIIKDNQESKEVIPSEDFFSKVKNAITNNVKEIPKNFMKFEGMIQKGVQNLISSESEERKRFRPTIAITRQCYSLENVSDDQILDALVETGGDIDNAICLLFTEKEN